MTMRLSLLLVDEQLRLALWDGHQQPRVLAATVQMYAHRGVEALAFRLGHRYGMLPLLVQNGMHPHLSSVPLSPAIILLLRLIVVLERMSTLQHHDIPQLYIITRNPVVI